MNGNNNEENVLEINNDEEEVLESLQQCNTVETAWNFVNSGNLRESYLNLLGNGNQTVISSFPTLMASFVIDLHEIVGGFDNYVEAYLIGIEMQHKQAYEDIVECLYWSKVFHQLKKELGQSIDLYCNEKFKDNVKLMKEKKRSIKQLVLLSLKKIEAIKHNDVFVSKKYNILQVFDPSKLTDEAKEQWDKMSAEEKKCIDDMGGINKTSIPLTFSPLRRPRAAKKKQKYSYPSTGQSSKRSRTDQSSVDK